MENGSVDNAASKYGLERLVLSIIINLIFGLAILTGLKALGFYLITSILISLVLLITGTFLLAKRLPAQLTGLFKLKPFLCSLWLLAALVAVGQTARLSTFMIEPTQTQYSLFPNDKWFVEHCCLTAYTESARMSNAGEKNIYDKNLYFVKGGLKDEKGFPPFRKISNFKVDHYHYPPTFLLLPISVMAIVGENFINIRMLWFSLGIIMLMITIGLIIFRLEPEGQMRMISMAPLLWCSIPVLGGLQMSNVQIIVVSISIISMLLFPIQRAVGGVLLAMSAVAKIFPGILGIYLLAQKKYREAFWAIGFAAILSLLAFFVVGPNPFLAFLNYELPKLSTGEAFMGPFSRIFAVARNMAPFGIPIKLSWLGVDGMSLETGRIISFIFLMIVVALAIWAGRQKPRTNTEAVSIWISLISLGSLVSPFAPANYVLVPLTMLICLNREIFSVKAAVVLLIFINAPFYISRQAPFIFQALGFLPAQMIMLLIPGYILYRAGLRIKKEADAVIEVNPAM